MSQDWILEVLSDLKLFARQNALPELTKALTRTEQVAEAEVRNGARNSGREPLILSGPPKIGRRTAPGSRSCREGGEI